MSELIFEVKQYETNINKLDKLKEMYKKGNYSYFAGTLCINVPDLVKNEKYTTVDIKPISEIKCALEREIMYYASLIYKRYKSVTGCFYKDAVQNIKEYEN